MHPDVKAALEVARAGALRHHGPGRTDTLEISVPGESFVVPADVVSALGQGNTEAGFKVLEKMYPAPQSGNHADGKVPIMAASGEYVIHPDHIRRIGGGNIKKGQASLNDFVTITRKKHIKTLKRLPGPHR